MEVGHSPVTARSPSHAAGNQGWGCCDLQRRDAFPGVFDDAARNFRGNVDGGEAVFAGDFRRGAGANGVLEIFQLGADRFQVFNDKVLIFDQLGVG